MFSLSLNLICYKFGSILRPGILTKLNSTSYWVCVFQFCEAGNSANKFCLNGCFRLSPKNLSWLLR